MYARNYCTVCGYALKYSTLEGEDDRIHNMTNPSVRSFFISFFLNNVRYVCMYSAKYIKARPFIGGRFSVLLKD